VEWICAEVQLYQRFSVNFKVACSKNLGLRLSQIFTLWGLTVYSSILGHPRLGYVSCALSQLAVEQPDARLRQWRTDLTVKRVASWMAIVRLTLPRLSAFFAHWLRKVEYQSRQILRHELTFLIICLSVANLLTHFENGLSIRPAVHLKYIRAFLRAWKSPPYNRVLVICRALKSQCECMSG